MAVFVFLIHHVLRYNSLQYLQDIQVPQLLLCLSQHRLGMWITFSTQSSDLGSISFNQLKYSDSLMDLGHPQ